MKNILLGIIAINLTFISINMTLRSIEPAHAANSDAKALVWATCYVGSGESVFRRTPTLGSDKCLEFAYKK